MRLTVIVPAYNAAATIGVQMTALAGQIWDEPWEVIVADNGSTDATRAEVERFRGRVPGLRLIDASARRGVAHGRNVAARAARADCLVWCDADDEVAPGWVAAIGSALAEDPLVASRFDYERLNPPWVRASRRNAQRMILGRFKYAPYFPHAGGSGLGVQRWLHEALGGFDESLICADTDYCYRAQLVGVKLRLVEEAVLHVRYRGSIADMYRQARNWETDNVLLHRRYRPADMPALPPRALVTYWARSFVRLAGRAPWLLSRRGRAAWAWHLGTLVGRIRGCLRHGVAAPR